MTERLLTQQELADLFNVTVEAVRKWRQRGKISFIRVGNTVRFEQCEVQAFIDRNRHNQEVKNVS